jgi:hypothetical protein
MKYLQICMAREHKGAGFLGANYKLIFAPLYLQKKNLGASTCSRVMLIEKPPHRVHILWSIT